MNRAVNSHKNNTGWCSCDVCVPRVKKDSNVVVVVKKDKRFLMDNNEQCIKELSVIKVKNDDKLEQINTNTHTNTHMDITEHLHELAKHEEGHPHPCRSISKCRFWTDTKQISGLTNRKIV